MNSSTKLDIRGIYKLYIDKEYHYAKWDGSSFYNKENTFTNPEEVVCLGINKEQFDKDLDRRKLL